MQSILVQDYSCARGQPFLPIYYRVTQMVVEKLLLNVFY